MIFFLYVSTILSVMFCICLFNRQVRRIRKKNYSSNVTWNYMCKYLIIDIFLSCILMITLVFTLPLSIWHIGKKDFQIESIVLDRSELKPLSTSDKKIYVKESIEKDVKIYTVKDSSNTLVNFNSNLVELIELDSTNDPRFESLAQYKINELKGSNIITKSVNDLYANINLDQDKGTFVSNKIKVYVPKGSIGK